MKNNYVKYYNVTFDHSGEKSYAIEKFTMIHASYYFYSTERYEHQREFMTMWGVIAILGGFSSVLIAAFGGLATFFNFKL